MVGAVSVRMLREVLLVLGFGEEERAFRVLCYRLVRGLLGSGCSNSAP